MDFVETINATGYWLRAVILNEWTHYQLALIAVGYLVCGVLARHIEPAVEARARTIKGNPAWPLPAGPILRFTRSGWTTSSWRRLTACRSISARFAFRC